MATSKDFFQQNFYEGVFADISDGFSEKAEDIVGTLSVADKVQLNQYWKSLYKALRYWEGLEELGEGVFVGYKGNQYIVEYERDGETATHYVIVKPDILDESANAVRAFYSSFTNDGAFAISRASSKDFNNALVIMSYFPKFLKEVP